MASSYEPTDRTTLDRHPERGAYDRPTVHAILDEALIGHLGFTDGDSPFVIPVLFARAGDTVYVHGSAKSRALKAAANGQPVCLTITLIDGLVMSRAVFSHSMNYRSVVILAAAGRSRMRPRRSPHSRPRSSMSPADAGRTPGIRPNRSWRPHWSSRFPSPRSRPKSGPVRPRIATTT